MRMRSFRLLLEISEHSKNDDPDDVLRIEVIESLNKEDGEPGALCPESVLIAHAMGSALQMASSHLIPEGETVDEIISIFRDGYVE